MKHEMGVDEGDSDFAIGMLSDNTQARDYQLPKMIAQCSVFLDYRLIDTSLFFKLEIDICCQLTPSLAGKKTPLGHAH